MQLFLTLTLFASSALAQSWSCGAHGNFPGTPVKNTDASLNDAYDCGRYCAVTTQCRGWAVGGAEGCQFINQDVNSFFVANSSSPWQFYQKYDCDYTTMRVTPSLTIPTPTPTGGVCGVKGWDLAKPGSFYSYTESSYQTLGGCYLQCQDRGSACQAFAIGGGYCLLYAQKMQGDIAADASSPNTYYDMDCISIVSSATTSTFVAPATSAPLAGATTAKTNPTSTTLKVVTTSVASSSTTQAPSVTAVASSTPNTCAVAGYDKQSPAAYRSDNTATTLSACTSICKSDSSCKGFAVGGGVCLLYSAKVGANVNADSGSSYVFYDIACFATSTASSSAGSVVSAAGTTLKTTTKPTTTLSAVTLSTSTSTSAAATATSTAATCNQKGYETSTADQSILGLKYKPTNGCKSFCTAKGALSYELYYDYCICFSKTVKNISSKDTTSVVVFNDISC